MQYLGAQNHHHHLGNSPQIELLESSCEANGAFFKVEQYREMGWMRGLIEYRELRIVCLDIDIFGRVVKGEFD